MEILPGRHRVRVEKKKFRPYEREITVIQGWTKTFKALLNATVTTTGHLTVHTIPKEATVELLNSARKFTQGMALLPGEYDLKISAVGHGTHQDRIILSAGEDKEITISLKKIHDIDWIEFVYIPPGTFKMGSPRKEKGRNKDETQHKVTLTKGFYMGKTEVTVGQFRRFITATGHKTEAEIDGTEDYWAKPGFEQTDSHPVTCVSWNDAQEFIKWLSRQ